MRVSLFVSIASFACVLLNGCQEDESLVRETVLSRGQSVEMTNKNGTIKISYVSPTKRRFEWDSESRMVPMIPRMERFNGKLGLYEPADSLAWPSVTRLVVEESVRNFDTESAIKTALIEGSAIMDWVYTNDGLVVGFGRTPARKQIDVDVFQFLLRGQKPSDLAGARPNQIHLIGTK